MVGSSPTPAKELQEEGAADMVLFSVAQSAEPALPLRIASIELPNESILDTGWDDVTEPLEAGVDVAAGRAARALIPLAKTREGHGIRLRFGSYECAVSRAAAGEWRLTGCPSRVVLVTDDEREKGKQTVSGHVTVNLPGRP